MDRDATFDGEEIQQLLERAAELQAASIDDSSAPGLTLQELEDVAESAGLNPRHVRQAAHELSAPQTTHASTDATDTHLFVERRIDRPMSDDVWQRVLGELRHRTGAPQGWSLNKPFEWSTTETIGDTREWTHHRLGGNRELRVSLSPRGDQTQIRLAQRTSTGNSPLVDAITYSFVLVAVLVPIAAGAFGTWTWSLVGGLVALVVGTPAFYAGVKAWRRSQHRSLETLADQLESALADSHAVTSAAGSTSQRERSSEGQLEEAEDQLEEVWAESSERSSSSESPSRTRRRESS